MFLRGIKKAVQKAAEAAKAKKQASEAQKPATPPQQTAKRSGGFRGLGRAIRSAAEKAKEARSSAPKSVGQAIGNVATGALGGRRLSERLKGKKGFGGFMGKAIGAAARRARMKGEEEEGTKPAAFKKGGAVKKGRGMGAATKGGGACAPRKPRKMNKGGMC